MQNAINDIIDEAPFKENRDHLKYILRTSLSKIPNRIGEIDHDIPADIDIDDRILVYNSLILITQTKLRNESNEGKREELNGIIKILKRQRQPSLDRKSELSSRTMSSASSSAASGILDRLKGLFETQGEPIVGLRRTTANFGAQSANAAKDAMEAARAAQQQVEEKTAEIERAKTEHDAAIAAEQTRIEEFARTQVEEKDAFDAKVAADKAAFDATVASAAATAQQAAAAHAEALSRMQAEIEKLKNDRSRDAEIANIKANSAAAIAKEASDRKLAKVISGENQDHSTQTNINARVKQITNAQTAAIHALNQGQAEGGRRKHRRSIKKRRAAKKRGTKRR